MSAQTQAAISTWVTLFGGIISVAFIVHASGSLTERLSEHDRTIIELKEADRASAADRRSMAVLLERCLSAVERLEKRLP
jgi:hypothetical protein